MDAKKCDRCGKLFEKLESRERYEYDDMACADDVLEEYSMAMADRKKARR